jgi:prepilin-type N-terminal cleavage/methylation domain-containing protein
MDMKSFKMAKGFTLAEVLITLTIIGIIASLTIPSLINNVQDNQLKTLWKKNYAEISDAMQILSMNQGGSLKGILYEANVINTFKPYFNTIKTCVLTSGCWHSAGNWKELDGDVKSYSGTLGMILNSGALLNFGDITTNCDLTSYGNPAHKTTCGYVFIDVNGFQSPNTIGRDIFMVHIHENSVAPAGTIGDMWNSSINNCANSSGYGCAAAYLLN